MARRHGEELEAAIRAAVLSLLASDGPRAVTMEAVAAAAHTSKPVLYRRYPSRAHMVVDAMPNLHWQADDVVDSQSLRDDLLEVFTKALNNFRIIGIDNYRQLIADADDTLLDSLNAQLTELATKTIYPALSRARARGEIGPLHIPHRAATIIGTLVRDELFFSRRDIDSTVLAEMLDTVYLPLITAISR